MGKQNVYIRKWYKIKHYGRPTDREVDRMIMDKRKLTGRNLGRVYNSKLRHASVYAMQLHTKQNGLT
jgi:hypothetical protein